ncbi:MAG: DMT family transporter [Gammaproteobacteria bacterium]|nr:DMT family transporter [Gammaproteobacteria bacterium]
MQSTAWLVGVAALGGVAVALQAQFMGAIDRTLGTLEAIFVNYVCGGILIALVLLGLRGGNLPAWSALPWYTWTVGAIGLVIVGSIGYSAPRLGLLAALTVLVAVQFITGALIEHFGLLGATQRAIDPGRMIGVTCMLLGTWLLVR